MHILHLERITVNHAGRVIFRDLSWAVDSQARVGLIGPNGAGKSSLLKVVIGELAPAGGTVTRMNGIRVGWLPQEPQLTPGRSLIDEALQLPPQLIAIESELARIEAHLSDPAIYNNSNALMRALAQQDAALTMWESLGGPRYAGKIRSILAHLGFTPDDYELPTESLSGGQKKLVKIARLLTEAPDILLLDEPDNHLDLDAKARLETLIQAYPGAVIIVSHDRYLLDGVATQIGELADGKLTFYPGNYSAYTAQREVNRLRQQQMYGAQQKEIMRIEEAIARFEHWARIVVNERHIKQARSRRKMLDRMEANGEIIEKVTERRTMDLQFKGSRGSTKALEIKNLSVAFGDDLLFLDLNFLLQHGERVGLIGANGAGKTVLFKVILGQLAPLDGIVKIGPSARVGYYAQEHETLAEWLDRTPIERVRDQSPMTEGSAVTFLGKFLFSYEQTRQLIGTLSGGERSRLQLACLMLAQPNLLLLDEPTNNLDIPSAEVLERALDEFEGSVLVISHDRYFLDQTVDRVIELADGALTGYMGGYTDYLTDRSNTAHAPGRARR
ncbi:MAG: ribosomal protection-like ABC-F family protein [Aggregatilineales bacterium]